MTNLGELLRKHGIDLYGIPNPNMKQNPINKNYHIFLMSDKISNNQESTAILIIEDGTDIWKNIDSHIKNFNPLAEVFFEIGIGIDLSGRTQVSIKAERESKDLNGKKIQKWDYHVYIVVQENKNKKVNEIQEQREAFLVIHNGTPNWYKMKLHLENLMYMALSQKQLTPCYIYP